MPEKQKTDIDALKEKVAGLELGLRETTAEPLDEPEKAESRIPQRLFAGLGDALQSYASIRQGGPGVQSNIERFLESRMTERKESREEIKRQREADIASGERTLARAEGELTFARGVGAQQEATRQEADIAEAAAAKDREHATGINEAKIAADEALQVADTAWRREHMRKGFEHEDTAKIDSQNQAAAQAIDMLIEGDGTSFYADPETGEQKEIDLTYQVAQGMPYEMFQNRIERVLLASGVSPLAEDALRRNADQAWQLAGGSLPGDPQDPVTAGGGGAGTSIGLRGILEAGPFTRGIPQAVDAIGAAVGGASAAARKGIKATRKVGSALLGEQPKGSGGGGAQ